ncbi:MAG: hypothetical protein RLZZ500_2670 [Bacteroidota bacterium]|jgi:hypothetical protein
MKHFYHQTFLFWVITKFLLAIAGLGSIYSILTLNTGFQSFEFIANVVILLYCMLLGYSGYSDIRSLKPNPGIRTLTGTISVIVGFSIIALIFLNVTRNPAVAFLLAIWLFLLGIYEWMQVERN